MSERKILGKLKRWNEASVNETVRKERGGVANTLNPEYLGNIVQTPSKIQTMSSLDRQLLCPKTIARKSYSYLFFHYC